jgi:ATP-dependent DNA ligase
MFAEPMLARAAEEETLSTKDWAGWLLEPKHDGMRAIVSRTDDGVEIYSRTGKSQKGKCPHLEKVFMDLPVGTILDGAIALVTGHTSVRSKLVPLVDFNKTMRIMGSAADKAVARQNEFGKVSFIIFDVIEYNGNGAQATGITQAVRSDVCNKIELPFVVHNPQYFADFPGVYAELIDAKVEGAILKNIHGTYKEGNRSKDWLKVKSAKTFDVVVSGFTDGQGKYEGQIGAVEFGAYFDDGGFVYVGRCSGMTDAERRYFTDIRDDKTYIDTPIVIEVKANEMVGSGEYRTPRHPQYQHIRTDRTPESCLMEQFKA